MERILIVEDTAETQLLIGRALKPLRAELIFASTVAEGLKLIRSNSYSLILLDIGLPDGTGYSLCHEVQNDSALAQTPVIFLTGKLGPEDAVAAFSMGADDFITKPFNPLAFRARIEGRLQKARDRRDSAETIELGNLRVELTKMKATLGNGQKARELSLTPTEFKILYQFFRKPEFIYSRDRILDLVWGSGADVVDRTIDTHISSLRKKIRGSGILIEPVLNEGYCLKVIDSKSAKKAA